VQPRKALKTLSPAIRTDPDNEERNSTVSLYQGSRRAWRPDASRPDLPGDLPATDHRSRRASLFLKKRLS
jgi:hypothetical protein